MLYKCNKYFVEAQARQARLLGVVYRQRNFRPWPENQERLEFAKKLGFNLSELINEVLRDNLQPHMEKKVEKLRKALSAPAR